MLCLDSGLIYLIRGNIKPTCNLQEKNISTLPHPQIQIKAKIIPYLALNKLHKRGKSPNNTFILEILLNLLTLSYRAKKLSFTKNIIIRNYKYISFTHWE